MDKINSEKQKSTPISASKPPPICLHENSSNAIVKPLTELIGNNNLHMVSLRKEGVQETKISSYTEEHYRKVSKYLTEQNKSVKAAKVCKLWLMKSRIKGGQRGSGRIGL